MNLTKVADSSPFASELLIPDDCFVLDNGLCGKIYIWKGMHGSSVSALGHRSCSEPSGLSHFENLRPSLSQNFKGLFSTWLGPFQTFRFIRSRLEPEHLCI